MALEHERARILDFVSAEKERRLPEIRSLGRSSSLLQPFVELTEALFDTLDSTLSARLEDITDTIGAISIDAASQRLNDISKGLETTISFIRTNANSQSEVPRELYNLLSWFFERCSTIVSPPCYVLSVSTDLATLEFRQLLASLFSRPVTATQTREIYPEIIAAFANRPCFFILIPAALAPVASSIDWPLIFHECVHAIEELANVIGGIFPGIPKNWEVLQLRAQAGDSTAREALWTQELLCDFVASHVTGPAFLWRFLRRYFSLQGVFHQSFSHPTFDTRMCQLIDLVRKRGFDAQAAQAESLMNDMVRDLGGLTALPPPASLAPSATASGAYEARIAGFDKVRFEQTLRERLHSNSTSLLDDLINRRPVVADPAVLFTLTTFEPKAEDPTIASLLADLLRLNDVASRFERLGLSG